MLTTFKKKIHEFTLVPSGGGCYEFTINGELSYSKLATGKFPDEAVIVAMVQQKLAGETNKTDFPATHEGSRSF